jgi:hypothetical protein
MGSTHLGVNKIFKKLDNIVKQNNKQIEIQALVDKNKNTVNNLRTNTVDDDVNNASSDESGEASVRCYYNNR